MDFLIRGASTTGSALDIVAGTIAGSTIGSEMDSIGDTIAGSTDTGTEGSSEAKTDVGRTG